MATSKGYRPALRQKPLEANIQQHIEQRLAWHGWVVRSLSQPNRVSRGLVGVPDVIAFKAGVTVLVECKRPGGKRRESQEQFAQQLANELRSTLCYCVADDVDDFAYWLQGVEAAAGVDTVREL